MKKRMKKQMAELMEVTVNVGKAMEVLAAVESRIYDLETTPMQGTPKKRSIQANADLLRSTAAVESRIYDLETTPMQGTPKKPNGQSGTPVPTGKVQDGKLSTDLLRSTVRTPVPTGEGSVKYDEETYIINKLLSLEKEHKSLEQKHNCLAEVVGELNMESHTHWWK